MENLTILKSVFRGDNIYWSNLTQEGKILFIKNELADFITEDFQTDRYHLSNFLDHYQLWDRFDVALGNTEVLPQMTTEDLSQELCIDWMSQSPDFSIDVFFTLLSNLSLSTEYREYMFKKREEYHQECCDCGYPMIIPDNITRKLLSHIRWLKNKT